MRPFRRWCLVLPGLLCASMVSLAAEVPAIPVDEDAGEMDFAELSLNELMNIEVVSVSRRAEPLRHAAAAVFVITGEEIRRSGVRSLADALRMVPGLQVRRSSAQQYTVTSRGFAADKLEVLLDGRSVYTPLTSTVFWDTLDTYLSDIERIEVIRGPGATLWGANAVNGVINIVTRDARDTPGTQVRGGGGNEERAFGVFRSTTAVGDDGALRLYAKGQERDSSVDEDGEDNRDGQGTQRAGFRYDQAVSDKGTVTVTGDVHDARARYQGIGQDGSPVRTYQLSKGGFLQTEWTRQTEGGGELNIEGSYTGYELDFPTVFQERRDTGDLGIQHSFPIGESQTLVWGAGARASRDETGGRPLLIFFEPMNRTLTKVNTYVQDQIELGEGGELTVGSKFEHNNLTGFEFQPGVRLGWQLGESFFTWGSVSRAVRTPNRLDSDLLVFCSFEQLTNPPCNQGESIRLGNPDLESEKLIAYEGGMRFWTETLSLEFATFYNDYTDLRSTETGGAPLGMFDNKLTGKGYGGEVNFGWAPANWLTLQAFYGLVKINVEPDDDSIDQTSERSIEDGTPQQSAGLRTAWIPFPSFNVDAMVRFVDKIRSADVPEYTELTLRTAWRVTPSWEFALVGDNLLDRRHPEASTGVELERSLMLEFLWTMP